MNLTKNQVLIKKLDFITAMEQKHGFKSSVYLFLEALVIDFMDERGRCRTSLSKIKEKMGANNVMADFHEWADALVHARVLQMTEAPSGRKNIYSFSLIGFNGQTG